ncbi:fumarylacetoacetate hydrolase family protein [Nocardia rosealba]|uniref:fumarylacetoacetate hydrolase family protein n=1 Tax=Nocardia rosealba TaxID=2878563 RepID=UPI001CD9F3DD|nr:fumarylacetoacetate hydrolase family protein [Nocardia rosealba]MCA2207236.1 fumarylacetoacetate hydrolase family protein [Nocardia rosealba]
MLYEQHVIDASRAMARAYLPSAYRAASLFERLTGRTFPRFKPAPLWYEQPIYYMGNALTFVPSGVPIVAPTYATALDYELELGFVLGRPLRDATPEEAMAAIAGYVVLNDVSARNVQLAEMRSGFGPQKAKHFISSLSLELVSASMIPDPAALTARVEINGQEIVRSSSAGMRHSIGAAVAHASRGEQLYAGELLATGTLPGCSGLENGRLLVPGDHLKLTIDGVGTIVHDIAAG